MEVIKVIFGVVLIFLLAGDNHYCSGQDVDKSLTFTDGIIKVFRGPSQTALGDGKEFCFTYPKDYFDIPEVPQKYYQLNALTDKNPCEDNPPGSLSSKVAFMKTYDGCNFSSYANFLQTKNASGLLLLITNNTLAKFGKELNGNYSLDAMALVGKITGDLISEFVNAGDVPEPWIQFRKNVLPDREFEGSILILWLIAVVCVGLGSVINPFQEPSSRQHILENEPNDVADDPNKSAQVHFNVVIVLLMVAFVSGTLMLLYFFYDYLVFFFIAVFCFASGRALYDLLNQVANYCTNGASLPRVKQCGIHQIVIAVICIALPVTWFVLRRDANIWILQDLLGISFCIHLIQTLRIPNLKICTLLLSLLFVYDIFFVFITPFFTSDGKSVMVEVATGGGSEETLPLLVKIPHLRSPPSVCYDRSYSLLGFGDIIIPGFLACFSRAFDTIRGDRGKPYFITALLGYGGGLAIAFVVLYLTQSGQPALLYIVPSMLIPLYIVGGIKGQVHELWSGTISITEVEP